MTPWAFVGVAVSFCNLLVSCVSSFTIPLTRGTRRHPARLWIKQCDDAEEIEVLRSSFEAMWHRQQQAELRSKEFIDEPIATRRRRLELNLLRSLMYSDEPVGMLLRLWRLEGIVETPGSLEGSVEEWSNPRRALPRDEKALRSTIDSNPQWADPCVLLAIHLLEEDRLLESYEMGRRALELKPWHFAVSHLFLLLSLRQGDLGQALHWARLRLPPLKGGRITRRRRIWVNRALEEANEPWLEDFGSRFCLDDVGAWE